MSSPGRLRELVCTLDGAPTTAASLPDDELERLHAALGEGPVRWVVATVDHTLGVLRARPDADALAPWPHMRALAEHVLAEAIERCLASEPTTPDERLAERAFADDIVARDIPLGRVVDTMRMMQHAWLDALVSRAVELGGAAEVPALTHVVTHTVDGWVGAFISAIDAERRRALQSEHARRRAMVRSLVAGEAVDDQVASSVLGVPVESWHLASTIGAPPGATMTPRALDAVADAVQRAVGTTRSVRHATGSGEVWLWVTTDGPVRVESLDALRFDDTLLVGIGEAHPGRAGFRRSHLESLAALAVSRGERRRRGALYRDVALRALLLQDPERAMWFAETVLQDLSADTDEMAELRETVRVFFDTRMRIAPAADRLFIHRNTLVSRLEKAERLMGHRLIERTTATQAALEVRASEAFIAARAQADS